MTVDELMRVVSRLCAETDDDYLRGVRDGLESAVGLIAEAEAKAKPLVSDDELKILENSYHWSNEILAPTVTADAIRVVNSLIAEIRRLRGIK